MDTIDLTLKFVNESHASAQTSDFSILIICLLILLITCILAKFKKKALLILPILLIASPAIAENSNQIFQTDKSIITATRTSEEIKTDTCTLTNISDSAYTIDSINVNIQENINMSINIFGVEVSPESQQLQNAIDVQPGQSSTVSFNIQNLSQEEAEKLDRKNILRLSLTPKEVKYKVKYDKGITPYNTEVRGDVPIDDNQYKFNEQATVKDLSNLESYGLAFNGLSEDPNAKRGEYQAGDKIKVTHETTLHPIWKIKYDAHRGCQTYGPENSIASFEAAGQRHLWAIETDLRMSSDGHIYCIHDSTFDRTIVERYTHTPVSGYVKNYDSNAISRMEVAAVNSPKPGYPDFKPLYNYDKLDARQRSIPTMDDYFRICSEYGCYAFVELKENVVTPGYDPIIVQMNNCIEKYNMKGKVVISSNNTDLLAAYRDSGGQDLVHLIFGKASDIDVMKDLGNSAIAFNYPDYDQKIDDFEYKGKKYTTHKELVDLMHSLGMQVCFRAVDNEEMLKKSFELGIDYFPTNSLF